MPRILVVDDEPVAVELLHAFLADKGLEVITASDGEEALRQVKDHRPHLILLLEALAGLNAQEQLELARRTVLGVSSTARPQ